ncbi:MAG: chemotaxis protein CheC [Thermotogota bacterium]|nr:chemotaxis protein CheC [Thermotogota bacterium]
MSEKEKQMALNGEQKDMLKELGNVGAGNAVTALSMLLNTKVLISVPGVDIVPFAKVPLHFDDPYELVVGVAMHAKGDAEGTFLLILDLEASKKILEILLGAAPASLTELGEMETSALGEIGNIMCGSYLVALSNFTNLNLESSPPVVLVDMISGIVAEAALMTIGEEYEDNVIFVETEISADVFSDKVKGMIFFIPGPGSLTRIFKAMGWKTDA